MLLLYSLVILCIKVKGEVEETSFRKQRERGHTESFLAWDTFILVTKE